MALSESVNDKRKCRMPLVSIIYLEIHYFTRVLCGEGWEERGKMQADLHEILDIP